MSLDLAESLPPPGDLPVDGVIGAGAYDSRLLEATAHGMLLFVGTACVALLAAGNSEGVEWLLFGGVFLVLLPLAIELARRRAASEPAAGRLAVPVAHAALAFVCVVGLRLTWAADWAGRTALWVWLILAVVLEVLGAAIVRRASLEHRLVPRLAALGGAHRIFIQVVVVLCGVLIFLPPALRSVRGVAEVLGIAAALCVAGVRLRRDAAAVPSRLIDLAVVIIALAVVPVVVFQGDGALVFNQNFFLGPANAVLHGRHMLVDVYSQYGVLSVYAVAALLAPVGLGYGTFSLLLVVLTILYVLMFYAALAAALDSRWPAALAVAVAIVATVLTQENSYVDYPSTTALRFGLPLAVVLVAVLGERRAGIAGAVLPVLLGVSSVWSFETFAYTAAVYVAVVATSLLLRDARGAAFASALAHGAGAVAGAQAVFAVATRAASGAWPDWIGYWHYISLYSIGEFGALPIGAWSPGLALAAVYFVSIVAIALVLSRRRSDHELERLRPAIVAAAGFSAMGLATYTYFLNRSHPNNLHHVVLPAVGLLALWLGVAHQLGGAVAHRLRPLLGACLLAFAAIAVDGAHVMSAKWSTMPIGVLTAAPPWQSPRLLVADVRRQWDQPVVDPRAAAGVDLLARYMPDRRSSLVLLQGELTPEVLLRANRGQLIALADPSQDALNTTAVARDAAAVAEVPPGTLMLTDMFGHPIVAKPPGSAKVDLVARLYQAVERRFRLVPVHADDGLAVVRLDPRPDA